MDRDRELTRVLVEFARTLTTDYSLESILDRLVHNAHVLSLKGPSIRKKKGLAGKNTEEMG